jgi:hypothetical protein
VFNKKERTVTQLCFLWISLSASFPNAISKRTNCYQYSKSTNWTEHSFVVLVFRFSFFSSSEMTHFPFDSLPLDIKLDVFSYLNFKTLFSRCTFVSKSWFKYSRDPRLRFIIDFRKTLLHSKTHQNHASDINNIIPKFIQYSRIIGSHIVVLNLANNRTLTPATFRQLITFCASPCLKTVIITRCFNLKDEDIQFLAEKCVSLERLQLDVIPITVRGVNAFTIHDHLKELSLKGCYSIDPESRILARREDKPRPHPLEKYSLILSCFDLIIIFHTSTS